MREAAAGGGGKTLEIDISRPRRPSASFLYVAEFAVRTADRRSRRMARRGSRTASRACCRICVKPRKRTSRNLVGLRSESPQAVAPSPSPTAAAYSPMTDACCRSSARWKATSGSTNRRSASVFRWSRPVAAGGLSGIGAIGRKDGTCFAWIRMRTRHRRTNPWRRRLPIASASKPSASPARDRRPCLPPSPTLLCVAAPRTFVVSCQNCEYCRPRGIGKLLNWVPS